MMPLEIKGARTRLGFTQNYMAEQLGISVHSYQKKESGKIPFTEKQKFGVAKLLGFNLVQINDFLFDQQLNDFIFDHQLPIGISKQLER